MTDAAQHDLFGPVEAPPATRAGLFAEVVFDRPLDHAYSYAVPEALREQIAVGKRVQAPFGRGDRPTVGYCVGLQRNGAGPRGQGDRRASSTTRRC